MRSKYIETVGYIESAEGGHIDKPCASGTRYALTRSIYAFGIRYVTLSLDMCLRHEKERRRIPTVKRRETENETKLTVLYTLKSLGSVTDQQLLLFMSVCDIMNWFEMKLGLLDLEDEGLVLLQAHPLGRLYEVTDKGDFCLRQFRGRIPVSKRALIDEKAEEWRLRFQNSRQSPAEVFAGENGRRWLQLRMAEGDTVLMDLTFRLPEGTEIHRLEDKWTNMAPELYRELLSRFETEAMEPHAVFLEAEDVNLTLFVIADPEKCREKWPFVVTFLRETILNMLKKDEPYTK